MDFRVTQRYFSSQLSQANVQSIPKRNSSHSPKVEKEKETIMYTAIKASGLSLSAARKRFGFENLPSTLYAVDQAIQKQRVYV